jgi:imidazolonepropionase-like amidohydrolase
MGEVSIGRGWVLRGDLWRGGDSEIEHDGVVLLDEDGRVVAAGPAGAVEVPAELPALGGPGCWIGPGLVDAHVHLAFGSPGQMVDGGVVAVRDLGAPLDKALGWQSTKRPGARVEDRAGPARSNRHLPSTSTDDGTPRPGSSRHPLAPDDEPPRRPHQAISRDPGMPEAIEPTLADPRMRGLAVAVAGPILTSPGGYPTNGWGAGGFATEVGTPEQARSAVEDLARQSVDLVKIALEPTGGQPAPPPDVVRAVVQSVHESGLRITAHALTVSMVERALDAGVDELAHMPVEPLPAAAVERLAAAGVTVVSTLHALSRYQGSAVEHNARALVAARVAVAYGTDLGNEGTRTGAEPRELELLADAGLGPKGAVVAATQRAAAVAGLSEVPGLGAIEVGQPARCVVLRGDPFASPGAWRDPVAVVAGGSVVSMDTPGNPGGSPAVRADHAPPTAPSHGGPGNIGKEQPPARVGSGNRSPRARLAWHKRDLLAGVTVALASLPIGALMGLGWERLAPKAHWVVQGGGAFLDEVEQADFIAADGWFAVLGVVVGALAGIAGYLAFRKRTAALPIAMAAGGLLGSLLAWWVGRELGPASINSHRGAPNGSTFDGPLDLSATGVLLAWPIAAVLAVLVLTLVFDRE